MESPHPGDRVGGFCGVMLGARGGAAPAAAGGGSGGPMGARHLGGEAAGLRPEPVACAGSGGPQGLPPAGGRRRGGAPPKPLEKAVCPAGRRGFCFKQTFVLNL